MTDTLESFILETNRLTDTLDTLDREISRAEQEIAAVQAAPQTFDEEWPAVERWVLATETAANTEDPLLLFATAPMFPETMQRQLQVLFGNSVVGNRDKVLESQRQRVKEKTAGGISAADKQRRLADLQRAIERTVAKRVLLVRAATKGDDEFLSPPPVLEHLVCAKQSYLEQLAAG